MSEYLLEFTGVFNKARFNAERVTEFLTIPREILLLAFLKIEERIDRRMKEITVDSVSGRTTIRDSIAANWGGTIYAGVNHPADKSQLIELWLYPVTGWCEFDAAIECFNTNDLALNKKRAENFVDLIFLLESYFGEAIGDIGHEGLVELTVKGMLESNELPNITSDADKVGWANRVVEFCEIAHRNRPDRDKVRRDGPVFRLDPDSDKSRG